MKAPAEAAGRSAECPRCRQRVRVPAIMDDPPAPPPVLAQTVADLIVKVAPPTVLPSSPSDWAETRLQIVDIEAVKSEWHSMEWALLNPLTSLLKDRPWTLAWVQLLTFAFCFPLVMALSYDPETPLGEAAWALSLYFAVLWAIFLHRCILPDRLRKRTVVGVWCATALLGCLAVMIVSAVGMNLPGVRQIFAASNSTNVFGRLIGFTLSVGFVEEFVKSIPVLWVAYRLQPGARLATSMYFGALSGLAFGATEALVYSVRYAAEHESYQMTYGTYLVVQVLRFVSLPLLHAVWSATLGYFIGLAASRRPGARGILVVGLTLVSVLHGAYNTVSYHWGGLAIAFLSLALFVCYVRRSQQVMPVVNSPPETA